MTFPSDIEIPIVYEDNTVVVVNKPSGLVVHSDGKTQEPTLVDWLLTQYPTIASVGESWTQRDGTVIPRPGIVHRLDRETSGVLVVAKTDTMFMHLKKQFQDRTIRKIYHAFVYGAVKADSDVINRPIGKSKKDFRLWSAQRGARGELREALTAYEVLARGVEASYVLVRPQTGRTHQIRVHFKAIHHPVVCDKLYAPKQQCILGFDRLALHAYTLCFTDTSDKELEVTAPLPEQFLTARGLL